MKRTIHVLVAGILFAIFAPITAQAVQPCTWDFSSLPSVGPYCSVYETLVSGSYATPSESCSTIARADMLMHLQHQMCDRLATEIASDPTKRHYAGKTNQQITDLLNNNWYAYATGTDQDGYTGLLQLGSILTVLENLGATNSLTSYSVQWDNATATTALRAVLRAISANGALTITLASNPPASVGLLDKLYIVDQGDQRDVRLTASGVTEGLPFGPNVCDVADVAAALTP